jgi:hypothetical protein
MQRMQEKRAWRRKMIRISNDFRIGKKGSTAACVEPLRNRGHVRGRGGGGIAAERTRRAPERIPEGPFEGIAQRAVFVIAPDGTVTYKWFAEEPGVLPDLGEVEAALASVAA